MRQWLILTTVALSFSKLLRVCEQDVFPTNDGLAPFTLFLTVQRLKWTVIFDNFHLLVSMLVTKRRRDAVSGFKRRSVCIYVDPILWMSSLLYVASRRPL